MFEQDEEKNKAFPQWLIQTVIAALIIPLILWSVQQFLPPYVIGKECEDIRKEYPFFEGVGIDLDSKFERSVYAISGEFSRALLDSNDILKKLNYEYRLKASSELENSALAELDFISLRADTIRARQRKANAEGKWISSYNKNFFQLASDSIICNCQPRTCYFKFHWGVPINPQYLFDRNFYSKIDSYLKNNFELSKKFQAPLNNPIDITSIISKINKDKYLINSIINSISSNPSFRNFEIGIPGAESEVYFRTGEFNLNVISWTVISIITNQYLEYIQKINSNKKYAILANGFSDPKTILSDIKYDGDAYWNEDFLEINLDTNPPANSRLIGATIPKGDYGNTPLSYARAYATIKAVQMMSQPQILANEKLKDRIIFQYLGNGVDNSSKSLPEKRRVELNLLELNYN